MTEAGTTTRANAGPSRAEARGEEATYFDFCAQGEIRIQRCDACLEYVYPPRGVCPACFHLTLSWELIETRGAIYSHTEQFRAGPGFAGTAPYVIVLVDLDVGVRMLARFVGDNADATIGARVVGQIAEMLPGWHAPVFSLAEAS